MNRYLNFGWILFCLCLFPIQAQTKRALSIGISEYTQEENPNDSIWPNINGTNDVDLLESALRAQGFIVTTIKNQEATATKIREGMNHFINQLHEGDMAFFHFSGHGQPVEDTSGDEDDGWDEAIIPVDARVYYDATSYQGENHILDDELCLFFEKARAKVGKNGIVYAILDACHMGSAYRGDDEEGYVRGTRCGFSPNGLQYRPQINSESNFSLSHNDSIGDICVLEACRSYQVNREIMQDDKFYGPLSYYLGQWLRSNSLGFDFHWIEEIQTEMKKDRRLIRQNMVSETSK
ncbi:MAG: caspase family protein [Bacteroidales bacterium]|nr:caspase family protein [Bacteroidales bacterium]